MSMINVKQIDTFYSSFIERRHKNEYIDWNFIYSVRSMYDWTCYL